jgi:polysaccharide export outer membrane protein
MMAMSRRRISHPIRRVGNRLRRTGTNIAPEAAAALPAMRRPWWVAGLATLWVVFLAQSTAISASADYRIHRGDVLEISVLGAPELHRRIMIDDNGKIYFPLAGELEVAGLSLSQLRQQLHDRLAANHTFHNPDVTVDVAEYRPVYVTDGVAKPGAYPYRPGMTVRDAIAIAGGYGRDMPLEGIDARDQYDALSISFVRLQIHIARLRAEIAGRTEIDLKGLLTNTVMPQVLSEFADIESQQLKTEQDDYNKETTHLQRLIKETQDQISALTAEQAQIQSELGQQHKSAALVRGLFQRSLVPLPRVEDEQRAVSGSETQLLEVRARIAQARKDLENYAGELQRQAGKRKIAIMQRLEAAASELATIRVHLKTAGERVRYVEARRPQGLQDSSDGSGVRNLVIFRNEDGNQQRIAADEDTTLLPGDAIAITASTPLVSRARSPEGRVAAQMPDPPLATNPSGQGQPRDGNRLGAAARAPLPPIRAAAVIKSDAVVAPPLPAAVPKPSAAVVYRTPVRTSGESAGSPVPPQPPHSALRNMRAAPTMPAGAVRTRIAPPVAAPSVGGQILQKAGDVKIIESYIASARLLLRTCGRGLRRAGCARFRQ